MKNIIFVILMLIFILLLACTGQASHSSVSENCDSISRDTTVVASPLPAPVIFSTNPDVEMTIENLDSLRIPVDSIVVKFTNNSDRELLYGTYFTVERENDGEWKAVWRNPGDTSEINVCFPAIGYILFPHTSSTYSNWTGFINRAFVPGKYRLTKTVSDSKSHCHDTLSVTFFMP